jgi:hypothetical protein
MLLVCSARRSGPRSPARDLLGTAARDATVRESERYAETNKNIPGATEDL